MALHTTTRRRLLAAIGAGTVAGLAGCSSSCPDDDPPEPDRLVGTGDPSESGFGSVPGGRWPAPRFDPANSGYLPDVSPPEPSGVVWRTSVPVPNTGGPPGPSVPTVANGRVFLASGAGITALELDDGSIAWRVTDLTPATSGSTTGYGDEVVAPVVGPDGTVYVGAETGLVAVDPTDGSERWRYDRPVSGIPTVADATVFVPTQQGLAAVGTDGTEQWTVDVGGETVMPAVSGQTVVTTDDRTRALATASGDERWSRSQTPTTLPVVDDDTVYLGTFEGLQAIEIGDGDQRWLFERGGGRGMSAPVITPDTLYVVEEPGEAGEATFALDPTSGTSAPEPRWCSYVGDGTVTAATDEQAYSLQEVSGPSTNSRVSLVAFTERFGEARWGLAGRQQALPPAVLPDAIVAARRDGTVLALGGSA